MMAVSVRSGSPLTFGTPVALFRSPYYHSGQPPTYDVAADGRFVMLKQTWTVEPGSVPFAVVVNWIDELRRRTSE
jgi:hypothetical protein